MLDLDRYREAWNDSFEFRFVDPRELTPQEAAVFQLTQPTIALANLRPAAIGVDEILISETMRLGELGDQTIGIYEREHRRIVIRRDQLTNPVDYCATLLHELTHAASGITDGSLDFQIALSHRLGVIAANALRGQR